MLAPTEPSNNVYPSGFALSASADTDDAVTAGLVVDDHGLTKPRGQAFGKNTRRQINRAAGSKRRYQRDWM